jgi:hypothetical protein
MYELKDKPAPVPLWPLQIPHVPTGTESWPPRQAVGALLSELWHDLNIRWPVVLQGLCNCNHEMAGAKTKQI